MRDTYAGNFDQLPSYNDMDNDISQPELGEENFASYERYILSNFVIDKSIDNYRQTWWNIYGNSTMLIK